MLRVNTSGSFDKMEASLKTSHLIKIVPTLRKYGARGVTLLENATPRDSKLTSTMWRYKIDTQQNSISLQWLNDSLSDDGEVPVVVLLVHGHGMKDGSFVQPNNFISPTIRPLLARLSHDLMKEV